MANEELESSTDDCRNIARGYRMTQQRLRLAKEVVGILGHRDAHLKHLPFWFGPRLVPK